MTPTVLYLNRKGLISNRVAIDFIQMDIAIAIGFWALTW